MNKLDEDKHTIYYTYLKPDIDIKSPSSLGPHISLTRTYESVCSLEEFHNTLDNVVKNQIEIIAKIKGIDSFQNNKVLLIESEQIKQLHKILIYSLLSRGSPCDSEFMYRGFGIIKNTPTGYKIVNHIYNPHISYNELEDYEILTKPLKFNSIYSAVKNKGKWQDFKEHSFGQK